MTKCNDEYLFNAAKIQAIIDLIKYNGKVGFSYIASYIGESDAVTTQYLQYLMNVKGTVLCDTNNTYTLSVSHNWKEDENMKYAQPEETKPEPESDVSIIIKNSDYNLLKQLSCTLKGTLGFEPTVEQTVAYLVNYARYTMPRMFPSGNPQFLFTQSNQQYPQHRYSPQFCEQPRHQYNPNVEKFENPPPKKP